MISNNKADQEYMKIHTGITSYLIPSICNYTKESVKINNKFVDYNKYFAKDENNLIVQMEPDYKWEELNEYMGIIHMPYEISTMSLFEQYTANKVLFFPSKEYLKSLIRDNSILFRGPYLEILKKDPEWVDWWLNRADYYDQVNMPYIQYYESKKHLYEIIKKITLNEICEISDLMKIKNRERKVNAEIMWRRVLNMTKHLTSFKSYKFDIDDVITGDKFLELEQNNIRYFKTDYLIYGNEMTWRNKKHPVDDGDYNDTIIIGHSDYSIEPNMIEKYLDKKIIAGSNMIPNGRNIIKLPLGITNYCEDSPLHKVYGDLQIMKEVSEMGITKNKYIYMNSNK
jgi:hypothetical protein